MADAQFCSAEKLHIAFKLNSPILQQDFEADPELKKGVKDLLEEMVFNVNLLPAEQKAAASILRVLTKDDDVQKTKVDLDELLKPPTVSSCYLSEGSS